MYPSQVKYNKKKPTIAFRIDANIKDILINLADQHNTNINQLVGRIITRYLQKSGYTIPDVDIEI